MQRFDWGSLESQPWLLEMVYHWASGHITLTIKAGRPYHCFVFQLVILLGGSFCFSPPNFRGLPFTISLPVREFMRPDYHPNISQFLLKKDVFFGHFNTIWVDIWVDLLTRSLYSQPTHIGRWLLRTDARRTLGQLPPRIALRMRIWPTGFLLGNIYHFTHY